VIGVIELKDHKTPDLASIENQAFGYKKKMKNIQNYIMKERILAAGDYYAGVRHTVESFRNVPRLENGSRMMKRTFLFSLPISNENRHYDK
jgi:hypothetical protein